MSLMYRIVVVVVLNYSFVATGFSCIFVVRSDCIRLVSENNNGSEGCPFELGKDRKEKCQTESNP
jgi:hypothetical protein